MNNTDAEGRLTLADALLYCQQQGVTEATGGPSCRKRPKRPKRWLIVADVADVELKQHGVVISAKRDSWRCCRFCHWMFAGSVVYITIFIEGLPLFSSLQEVVDIATLTGACMVALGKDITGWDLRQFSKSYDTR